MYCKEIRIRKEVTVAYLKVLFPHLPGMNKDSHICYPLNTSLERSLQQPPTETAFQSITTVPSDRLINMKGTPLVRAFREQDSNVNSMLCDLKFCIPHCTPC
jgi:hypothetical protein